MNLFRHIVLFFLLGSAAATAQNATPATSSRIPQEENLSIRKQQVPMVKHGSMDGLSIIDGKLCLRVDGVFYSSHIEHYTVRSMDVDPSLENIDDKATFITRHNVTGHLLFTRHNRAGRTVLYRYLTDGKRAKAQEVKLGNFDFDIQHPAFTADGKTMVFASDCPTGSAGGMDLWYSQWQGESWSFPKPLGSIVNSSDDDMAPFICGDYLYFSSNRGQQDSGNFDFYVCRLISSEAVHGDTVYTNPIGKGKVQRLIAPLSSDNADCELVLDEEHNCGFWIVHPLKGEERADILYSFEGSLASIRLSGTVYYNYSEAWLPSDFTYPTEQHGPLAQCDVAVYDARQPHGTPLFIAKTDSKGRYSIFLQPGYSYKVVFHKDGFKKATVDYTARHDSKDELCVNGSLGEDVQVWLTGFFPNIDYTFLNDWYETQLFDPVDVGTALSRNGREQLQTIAQFLIDNPNTYLYVTTIYTKGSESFNKLVTMARQDAIEQYFFRQGVPAKVLNNAKYESVVQNEQEDNPSNATTFFFSTQPIKGGYDDATWRDNKNSLHHFLEGSDEEPVQRVQMWSPDLMKKNKENKAARDAIKESTGAKTSPSAPTDPNATKEASIETNIPAAEINTPDPSSQVVEPEEEDEVASRPSESFRKMLESGTFNQE